MDPHQSYNPFVNVKLNPPDPRERVPQWTQAETAELLAIRAELDASFLETKRNKPLWEDVAARMHVKGFPRTPDQCKSKWKNLLTRFKGSESMEAETSRQFPFHEEMQRIFSGRMERLLNFEEEKGKETALQAAEESEEEEEEAEATKRSSTSKKRIRRKRGDDEDQSVKSILKKMMTWQKEMEERMLRDWEMRENERRLMENQWRRSMQALQEERMVMEQQWRAREEDRRARAEERAEHRHQLMTAILNKLAEKGL